MTKFYEVVRKSCATGGSFTFVQVIVRMEGLSLIRLSHLVNINILSIKAHTGNASTDRDYVFRAVSESLDT